MVRTSKAGSALLTSLYITARKPIDRRLNKLCAHFSVKFNWTNQKWSSFGYIFGNLKCHASCIFCPKMSFYGKRKSRDYLSDDEPTDNNKKMPNINEFRSEIVESDVVPKSEDTLYSAKKLNEGEEVEEGSIACFIPEGQGILGKLLEKINEICVTAESANSRAAAAESEAIAANARAVRAQAESASLRTALQDLTAVSLKNDVVHLVHCLTHQKLYSFVSDNPLAQGLKVLRFNNVLSIVDPATKAAILNDPACIALQSLDWPHSDFRKFVGSRNNDIHPREINLETVNSKIESLESTEHLTVENSFVQAIKMKLMN